MLSSPTPHPLGTYPRPRGGGGGGEESRWEVWRPSGSPVGDEGLCMVLWLQGQGCREDKPLLTRWYQFLALRERTFRGCEAEREAMRDRKEEKSGVARVEADLTDRRPFTRGRGSFVREGI